MDNIKFTNAQQSKMIYKFKNTKEKLCKTKAAVWYNKMCKINQITTIYSKLKYKVTIEIKTHNVWPNK